MNNRMMILFLALLGAHIVAWAEPLAVSAKMEKMFAMAVNPEERKVPDASEVGIPAYPGSQFCYIKKNDMSASAWSEVALLSTESFGKVSAWYQKKLKGWYCDELSKGARLICSDKDPGPAGRYGQDPETFNVVDVVKIDVAIPCVLKGMQTSITIKFQPD